MSDGHGWHGHTSARRQRGRRRALVLALVVLSPALSGCVVVDFFTPQKDEEFRPSGDGLVRIWAAARPGGLGPEFVHYNVSFGFLGHLRDAHLTDIAPMESTFPTVDLVTLSGGKAKLMGQLAVPPGDYHGFAFTTTGATSAREQDVGMDDCEPVHRIIETTLRHRQNSVDIPVSMRVQHAVVSTVITDLYLEIDLERSLVYEDGVLRHHTAPYAVSVYIQGKKVARETLDGGLGALIDEGGGGRGYMGEGVDKRRFKSPWSEPNVYDTVSGRQLYSATAMPSKRINRAIGLEHDVRFDGSGSMSFVAESGVGRMPIVDWRWEFGDGTTASGPIVEKNYTQGGLHEVYLTVRDDYGLVGQNHLTLFVPYTADQAEATQTDARSGEVLVGSATAPTETTLDSAHHTLEFPQDLQEGALYLGGYRVTLTFSSGLGSAAAGVTTMELRTDAGHFQGVARGTSPLVLETAGMPVWRGPLLAWADPTIGLDVELVTGLAVDYTVTVEALYYDNLSRGLDPHAAHIHGPWNFGPIWDHLDWRGRVIPLPEED